MFDTVMDTVGLISLLLGSLLCLTAAIGVLRFRDLLTRMHAGTKPQVLGLLLVLLGVGLQLRTPSTTAVLLLIGLFQFITVPVAAQMVARAAERARTSPADPGELDD